MLADPGPERRWCLGPSRQGWPSLLMSHAVINFSTNKHGLTPCLVTSFITTPKRLNQKLPQGEDKDQMVGQWKPCNQDMNFHQCSSADESVPPTRWADVAVWATPYEIINSERQASR